MKLKRMIKWTSAIWCFACIEVLLIGVFEVEQKFTQLVGKLAGDTNAGFLEVNSGLGSGFYILIAYSVVAGFLQWSLLVRYDEKKQLVTERVSAKENDVQCKRNGKAAFMHTTPRPESTCLWTYHKWIAEEQRYFILM